MLTCRKTYSDIPFAHRQHSHDGHCAWIHGHNWSFTLTFACEATDANGFVVDFGKLGYLRDWIRDHLDHACVFSRHDTLAPLLIAASPQVWKVYWMEDNTSCEALARHLLEVWDALVRHHTGGRVWLKSVEVAEDSRNSACYEH